MGVFPITSCVGLYSVGNGIILFSLFFFFLEGGGGGGILIL